MKILKIVAVLIILVSFSCKKDTNEAALNALAGHWHISNFEPDSATETALLSKQVIAKLVTAECFPLEYSFTTGGRVSHIDKMGFLEATAGENGVEVDCYFEDVFKDGSFSINDNVLTITYDDETQVYNTVVTENSLTILRGAFTLNDEKVFGKLIFSRETF